MTHSVVLASQSPRRKELMKFIPIAFEVIVKSVEEKMDNCKTPEENVMGLAEQKATAVALEHVDRWVVGCDTIVVCDEIILGKPKSEQEAFEMLRTLGGRSHRVLTGVCIMNKALDVEDCFVEETTVYFKEMSDEEIKYYVSTLEPMDKAGAYGIQGYASIFVEKIQGDYYNVMGLPVHRVYNQFKKLGMIQL